MFNELYFAGACIVRLVVILDNATSKFFCLVCTVSFSFISAGSSFQ